MGRRPHTGIFKAADLIFRFEASRSSPQRQSTQSPGPNDFRRHMRDVKDFECVYTDPRTRRQSPLLSTTANFRFDSQIRMLESRNRLTKPAEQGRSAGSSPIRPKVRRVIRDDLFDLVVTACSHMPPSVSSSFAKAKTEQTVSLKTWRQTQERLRKMMDYDPDLLVPLYALEKGADVFNETEVINTARTRRAGGSPFQRMMKPGRKTGRL